MAPALAALGSADRQRISLSVARFGFKAAL